jgi:hypothetical protein
MAGCGLPHGGHSCSSRQGRRRTLGRPQQCGPGDAPRHQAGPEGAEPLRVLFPGRQVPPQLRALLHATKIPDFRFHDLRHTFASRLAMDGVDLYTIQRAGGWKTQLMVQRYAHLSPDHIRAAVERSANPLSGSGTGTRTGTDQAAGPTAATEVPEEFGAPGGIRTPDPRLRRPMLYPTELQAQAGSYDTPPDGGQFTVSSSAPAAGLSFGIRVSLIAVVMAPLHHRSVSNPRFRRHSPRG